MEVNIYLVFCVKGSTSLLNMTLTIYRVRFGASSLCPLTYQIWEMHLSLIWLYPIATMTSDPILSQILPNSRVVSLICSREFQSANSNHLYLFWHFLQQSWITLANSGKSYVLCRWCGKNYGPPSMDYFLSTPTHYPRRLSRNSLSVPWIFHVSTVASSHSTIGSHH